MRITVLAGGVGGARFLKGLRKIQDVEISVVVNNADDISMYGVRICPDLDSIIYNLAGVSDLVRGWGRADETWQIQAELARYTATETWFNLGDKDFATHIHRSFALNQGSMLHEVVAQQCATWGIAQNILPATNDQIETQVILKEPFEGRSSIHFQEWWVRHRAKLAATAFEISGIEEARPAPGVIEAITDCDIVIFAPSNPIVSIGSILQIPGVREAVVHTDATVVGISPIIGSSPLLGMADVCMSVLGLSTSSVSVAKVYGSRGNNGLLDGWLIADSDSNRLAEVADLGLLTAAVPLLMSDDNATLAMAEAAIGLVMKEAAI
jgi:LPPG:FO 2-phospho-L-lactate transferase